MSPSPRSAHSPGAAAPDMASWVCQTPGPAFVAVLCNGASEACDPLVGNRPGAGAVLPVSRLHLLFLSSSPPRKTFVSLNLTPCESPQMKGDKGENGCGPRQPGVWISVLPGTTANRSFLKSPLEGAAGSEETGRREPPRRDDATPSGGGDNWGRASRRALSVLNLVRRSCILGGKLA